MPGQIQQARVEMHDAPHAVERRRFRIVVHEDAGAPAQRVHGLDVPAQDTFERLVQREDGVQHARVAEHEGGEGPRATADPNRAEAASIDLRHLPGRVVSLTRSRPSPRHAAAQQRSSHPVCRVGRSSTIDTHRSRNPTRGGQVDGRPRTGTGSSIPNTSRIWDTSESECRSLSHGRS